MTNQANPDLANKVYRFHYSSLRVACRQQLDHYSTTWDRAPFQNYVFCPSFFFPFLSHSFRKPTIAAIEAAVVAQATQTLALMLARKFA